MFRFFAFLWMTLSILSLVSTASAQDKAPFKFGKVDVSDFKQKIPDWDPGAHAVIIGDIGYSRIVPSNSGGFGYEFERKIRVYIADKNGVDAGKFHIPLFSSATNDLKEEIRRFTGVTYNLENGKVVETKLDNNEVFTERVSKYRTDKKFSMPALREGSIFELSYLLRSDYIFQFRDWTFQSAYPTLWSEYEVEIPEYYEYVFLSQGFQPYHVNKSTEVARTYRIKVSRTGSSASAMDDVVLNAMAKQNRWVMKNVPSLKKEKFITTLENYRSKIEFQLSTIRFPHQVPTMVMENWPKVYENLMKDESFGDAIRKADNLLDDELKPKLAAAGNPEDKAKIIYNYIRDNFNWNGKGGIYTSGNLRNVVKTKTGSVADINLLLIATLKRNGIEAYPVILSTRDRGYTHEFYPLIDRFNYVVCAALIGENDYMLDATEQDLGFGHLPIRCYNGHARVLMDNPLPISLSPDSLLEKKTTLATVIATPRGASGSIQSTLGYYESTRYRGIARQKGKDAIAKSIKEWLGSEFELENVNIDSLGKLDMPVKLSYEYSIKNEEDDLLYLDPVIEPFIKENPFQSASRSYPVEMPYRIDETYLLNMEIPEGYVVDEIPKSAKVGFNEGEGYFEYLISKEADRIQLRTRVVLAKTQFQPEEYESLREFFGFVINKQAEQIVLKKAQ